MTLKQHVTRIGKIGLIGLISLYSLNCSDDDEAPRIVEGIYNGYKAKSFREGPTSIGYWKTKGRFNIVLEDTTDDTSIHAIYYAEDNSFPEIGARKGPTGRIPLTHPLTRYQNPDSLLAVHKALRGEE